MYPYYKHAFSLLVLMGVLSIVGSGCSGGKGGLTGFISQIKNNQLAGQGQPSPDPSTSPTPPPSPSPSPSPSPTPTPTPTSTSTVVPTCSSANKSNVTVSWSANIEKGVNSAGGGYRVYYSQTPNFAIASAPYANVPYASGPVTSTTLSLARNCTHYIKVVAYSSIGTSSPSGEFTVQVH